MSEQPSSKYLILSSSFGSADDILNQLHAHQDVQSAIERKTLKKQGHVLKAKEPFRRVAIHDLCAADFSNSAANNSFVAPSREQQGFSSVAGIQARLRAVLESNKLLPAPSLIDA